MTSEKEIQRSALIVAIDAGIKHLTEEDGLEACDDCKKVIRLLKIMRSAAMTQQEQRDAMARQATAPAETPPPGEVSELPTDYAESAK